MFSNDQMIQRFCDNINRESKEKEKNELRKAIDQFLETDDFKVSVDTTEPNGTATYRIDFSTFDTHNFNLNKEDFNEILDEYRDVGYRCCGTIGDYIRIIFQTFICVTPSAIPNPYNYVLPISCTIIPC